MERERARKKEEEEEEGWLGASRHRPLPGDVVGTSGGTGASRPYRWSSPLDQG